MTADAWITLIIVALTVVSLVRDILPPSATMVGAMVAVMAFGIVEPQSALAGFSNPAPITIAALYVVAGAVERTGVLQPLQGRIVRIVQTIFLQGFPFTGEGACGIQSRQ